MGEEEEYTQEEKEELGLSEEDEGTGTHAATEDKEEEKEAKTEQTTEAEKDETAEAQQAEEEVKDKDGNVIPPDRIEKLRWEKGEVQRKLDLLQRDPEEYYKTYPDEKPEVEEEEKLSKGWQPSDIEGDIWDKVIKGGPYDGERLGDVYDQGGQAARYALGLYNTERDSIRTEATRAEAKSKALLDESQTEISDFVSTLAGDFFEKKPDELSEEEGQQISSIIDETLDWMKETNRGSGVIGDAYFLKNKEKILAGEQIKGISGVIKSSQGISSVSNKKDLSLKTTGYEGDMSMSADELADKIDGMSDDQFVKYSANAPQKLKDKYPGLPW